MASESIRRSTRVDQSIGLEASADLLRTSRAPPYGGVTFETASRTSLPISCGFLSQQGMKRSVSFGRRMVSKARKVVKHFEAWRWNHDQHLLDDRWNPRRAGRALWLCTALRTTHTLARRRYSAINGLAVCSKVSRTRVSGDTCSLWLSSLEIRSKL